MTAATGPDLTNLPRFLDHLSTRDAEAAQFARLLLTEDQWQIRGFWGPEQMDVWQLDLERGDWFVQFRIERGISEGVRTVRSADTAPRLNDYRNIGYAIFAWARAKGVPFRLDDPDDVAHDIVAHGRTALDWLASGHHAAFERVAAAADEYRSARWTSRGRGGDLLAAQTAGIAAMEAAAVG